jgi:hypothetical protein
MIKAFNDRELIAYGKHIVNVDVKDKTVKKMLLEIFDELRKRVV